MCESEGETDRQKLGQSSPRTVRAGTRERPPGLLGGLESREDQSSKMCPGHIGEAKIRGTQKGLIKTREQGSRLVSNVLHAEL